MLKGSLLCALAAIAAWADDAPKGKVIDNGTFALYVPTAYSKDSAWPLIVAFDPRARGRVPAELFQTAAETYGYIVVGSNVSRNGSMEQSWEAARAMLTDVSTRYSIHPKRIYAAGLSGGARVSFALAMGSNIFSGVIASAAGFHDGQMHKTAAFPIFATTGTEDFNYLEMRSLDRELTSPHRLVVFEGGHAWLSSELAIEAVEWMELQAMKAGSRPKDDRLIGMLFTKRSASIDLLRDEKEKYVATAALAADFDGLRDVTEVAALAATLAKTKAVKDGLKEDRDNDERESRLMAEVFGLERNAERPESRSDSLRQLRQQLISIKKKSAAKEDSAERRSARRVLQSMYASVRERGAGVNAEVRKLVEEIRGQ